jgi:hypothetical protein
MGVRLNPDISFCELDGQLFLLDIQRDRYFQLSRTLELGFRSYLQAPDNDDIDVHALFEHGLLLSGVAATFELPTPTLPPPSRSVLETSCASTRTSACLLCDVLLAVYMTHWQLKTQQLKPILQSLSDYRHRRTSPLRDHVRSEQQLLAAASAFNRLRPIVPIQTCCLIDSLSMIRFLAKRGLHSHLVMGVACDPFSAHAWAQQGSLVLNETLGAAQAHVPIRVI